MRVFKYGLKRISTALSIYLILAIFIILPAVILIWVPRINNVYQLEEFKLLWKVITFNIILFFSASFVANLISKTITEERDDGTFLIIISKPISRWNIWLGKMSAIFLAMMVGFTLVMFLPLLTILVPTNHFTVKEAFDAIWKDFGNYYFVGFQVHLFIFAIFATLAYFIGSKSLVTASSMFVVVIIVINITLQLLDIKGVFYWLEQIYVYIPVLVSSGVLIGISNYIFINKSFT